MLKKCAVCDKSVAIAKKVCLCGHIFKGKARRGFHEIPVVLTPGRLRPAGRPIRIKKRKDHGSDFIYNIGKSKTSTVEVKHSSVIEKKSHTDAGASNENKQTSISSKNTTQSNILNVGRKFEDTSKATPSNGTRKPMGTSNGTQTKQKTMNKDNDVKSKPGNVIGNINQNNGSKTKNDKVDQNNGNKIMKQSDKQSDLFIKKIDTNTETSTKHSKAADLNNEIPMKKILQLNLDVDNNLENIADKIINKSNEGSVLKANSTIEKLYPKRERKQKCEHWCVPEKKKKTVNEKLKMTSSKTETKKVEKNEELTETGKPLAVNLDSKQLNNKPTMVLLQNKQVNLLTKDINMLISIVFADNQNCLCLFNCSDVKEEENLLGEEMAVENVKLQRIKLPAYLRQQNNFESEDVPLSLLRNCDISRVKKNLTKLENKGNNKEKIVQEKIRRPVGRPRNPFKVVLPKRPVGRPRKNAIVPKPDVIVDVETSSESQVVKRGPGRPRKTKDIEVPSMLSIRGMEDTIDFEKNDDEVEEKTTPKRGRPKGSKDSKPRKVRHDYIERMVTTLEDELPESEDVVSQDEEKEIAINQTERRVRRCFLSPPSLMASAKKERIKNEILETFEREHLNCKLSKDQLMYIPPEKQEIFSLILDEINRRILSQSFHSFIPILNH